jgi:hypothetical protein
MIGRNPKMKLMQVSHNAELATRFGSKVRNLMETEEYRMIFGDVRLREDSKAKGREKIVKQKAGGKPIMVENTLQRVLAVLLQDEGPICLLLMTHILNKTQCLIQLWIVRMTGIAQDLDNVYNQAEEL